jgi:cytochrome c biogenesis protein CcmG, thiol:disulfide interchange protein DsbE
MGKAIAILAAVGVVALLVVGLLSADGGSDADERSALSAEEARTALADAPGPLRALYADANELVGGGTEAFERRIESLRGTPVVVNKWASWCAPCRAEFPHFQRQARRRGREVAFIGVNSLDNSDEAREFLARFPLPYPSFEDGDGRISQEFRGNLAFPTTAFYDSEGELNYVKQGQYRTEADLVRDIERYAR